MGEIHEILESEKDNGAEGVMPPLHMEPNERVQSARAGYGDLSKTEKSKGVLWDAVGTIR